MSTALWNRLRNVLVAAPIRTPENLNDGDGVDISKSISNITKDPIARGGFCDLYLGDLRGREKVAMRRPRFVSNDEATIRRFHREVSLLCRVHHPNILPFLGTCREGLDFYMVSPYMKNGDLWQWMEKGYSFNRTEILYQIARALTHLHAKGIVHGDVKAQNVLLSDEGSALLCDFGLAKALDSMVTSMDVKGRGSTRWMAPELFDNNPKSKESDVYAFGMTIVEVLTGKPPLHHIHNYAIVAQVATFYAKPERPDVFEDETHIEIWEAGEKCWARERSDRPLAANIFGTSSSAMDNADSNQQDPLGSLGGGLHAEVPRVVEPSAVSPVGESLRLVGATSPVPAEWVFVERQEGPDTITDE